MKPDLMFRIIIFFQIVFLSGLMLQSRAQEKIDISDVRQYVDGKEYYIHLVEPGQTLYSISRAYKVSVDEIVFENPGTDRELSAYQNLRIPVVSRDEKIAKELRTGEVDYIYHIVNQGQTLYSIAKIYEVDQEAILQANPGISSKLKTGQYLKIPVATGEEEETFVLSGEYEKYRVQPGETFFSISKKYEITVDELRLINPDVEYPKAGDFLRVPKQIIAEETVEDEAPAYYLHTVLPGETLYGIARYYRVPIDSIRYVNPDMDDRVLAGMTLNIPLPSESRDYITHRVRQPKEKLKTIAKLYDADIKVVKSLNPRLAKSVYFNQEVFIPVASDAIEPEMIPVQEVPEEVTEVTVLTKTPSKCRPSRYSGRKIKVALMIPLYLEEVMDISQNGYKEPIEQVSYKPFQFLPFYNGVRLAIDSLKRSGLNVDLYVYDVDQEISKTIKVLQDKELQEVDLIIGPFFRSSFKYVSSFAKIFGIKIVNPLSESSEVIENNDLSFKFSPSETAGIYQAADYISKNFPEHRIILVRHNKYRDVYALNELTGLLRNSIGAEPYSINNALLSGLVLDQYMPESRNEELIMPDNVLVEGKYVDMTRIELAPDGYTNFANDVPEVIYLSDSIHGIVENASVIRPNLIVAFADDEVFAIELMRALNGVKDTFNITLIGLSDWQRFSNLEPEYLMNFNTHILSPSYIDYHSEPVVSFIDKYRRAFLDEPNDYAFTGFDAACFFLSGMMRYGTTFEDCIQEHHPRLLRSKYLFKDMPGRGFENIYWNIYKYKNFKMINLQNDFNFQEY